jgi:Na+/proline symporter
MTMVLLLPALAIAAVTGLNVFTSVLLMDVVTTIYTVKGGLKAAMLTEAIQGATMLVGIALIVGLAITALLDGMTGFIETSRDFQKFDMALWTWNETMPVIWKLFALLGGGDQPAPVLDFLGTHGIFDEALAEKDQAVESYFSLPGQPDVPSLDSTVDNYR